MPRVCEHTRQPSGNHSPIDGIKMQLERIDLENSPARSCVSSTSAEGNSETQQLYAGNELNWDETKSIMTELETLFKSTEEVKQIAELPRLLATMKETSQGHVQTAKELIKNMTRRIDDTEDQLVPPLTESEQAGELDMLKKNQSQASTQIDNLTQEIGIYTNEIQELTLRRESLENEMGKLNVETVTELPRLQHSLMLYSNITGIQWDHSKRNVIAGVVGDSQKVREFEFDPMKYSKFEIAEELWSVIDPEN